MVQLCASAASCASLLQCRCSTAWPSARLQHAHASGRQPSALMLPQQTALPLHSHRRSSAAQTAASGRSDGPITANFIVGRHQRQSCSASLDYSPTWQQQLLACMAALAVTATALLGGPDPALARSRLTADELNTIELFKESTPSVVYITNLASKCAPTHASKCHAVDCR